MQLGSPGLRTFRLIPSSLEPSVLTFEVTAEAEPVAVEPLRVTRVDDEPALARRESSGVRPLERSLGYHAL